MKRKKNKKLSKVVATILEDNMISTCNGRMIRVLSKEPKKRAVAGDIISLLKK